MHCTVGVSERSGAETEKESLPHDCCVLSTKLNYILFNQQFDFLSQVAWTTCTTMPDASMFASAKHIMETPHKTSFIIHHTLELIYMFMYNLHMCLRHCVTIFAVAVSAILRRFFPPYSHCVLRVRFACVFWISFRSRLYFYFASNFKYFALKSFQYTYNHRFHACTQNQIEIVLIFL